MSLGSRLGAAALSSTFNERRVMDVLNMLVVGDVDREEAARLLAEAGEQPAVIDAWLELADVVQKEA